MVQRTAGGATPAALAVSAPESRVPKARVPELVRALRQPTAEAAGSSGESPRASPAGTQATRSNRRRARQTTYSAECDRSAWCYSHVRTLVLVVWEVEDA